MHSGFRTPLFLLQQSFFQNLNLWPRGAKPKLDSQRGDMASYKNTHGLHHGVVQLHGCSGHRRAKLKDQRKDILE